MRHFYLPAKAALPSHRIATPLVSSRRLRSEQRKGTEEIAGESVSILLHFLAAIASSPSFAATLQSSGPIAPEAGLR